MTGDAIERALEELRARASSADGRPDTSLVTAISNAYAELARMRAAADEQERRQEIAPPLRHGRGVVPLAVLADMQAHDRWPDAA
ncbi:MAG TPA: hypothetical protein VHL31_00710 [Geminicoccus sp.]|uniref:hypothetical protein n=1 Tax=Geminicoccus sp. TaxID=2024832 RepID=UPI002E313097|nr:hypothetical protein [Geminicoccus sp.]HEX2524811.1 hypothetical protein [Geminicoccus sp.]